MAGQGGSAAETAGWIAYNVYQIFGEDAPNSGIMGGFSPVAKIGVWLDSNLSVTKHEIVKLNFNQTRYHNNAFSVWNLFGRPWLIDKYTADHGIAPVIRIGGTPGTTNGTLVGTDKFRALLSAGLLAIRYGLRYGPRCPFETRPSDARL